MGDQDSNNILSVLDNYTFETVDDIALKLAEDFRRRRIEKNLTREEVAQLADVALSSSKEDWFR